MKKALSVLLTVILISCCFAPALHAADKAAAPVSMTYREYYDEYGIRRGEYRDAEGNLCEKEPPEEMLRTDGASQPALPSRYDARDYGVVTPVKNQGAYSTCWAHAFCSCAESSLISGGYAGQYDIDLSEAHLVCFTFNTYNEGSGDPAYLDSFNTGTPFWQGGTVFLAAATAARGSGLTTEERFPYNAWDDFVMFFNRKYSVESEYQIERVEKYEPWDTEKAKAAITETGSVALSYIDVPGFYRESPDGYCFYGDDCTGGSKHMISVVGWDDGFPASDFAVTPPSDGAWLCKNSWGTAWGDDGYFWLSYCESTADGFFRVTAKPSENYERRYQYDGIVTYGRSYVDDVDTAYAANVFTAEKTDDLKKVYFKAEDACTCSVSIYTGLTDPADPTSGTLRETMHAECPGEGYYSVYPENVITVPAGEKFSVVVGYHMEGSYWTMLPTEEWNSFNDEPYTKKIYNASAGQSFTSDGSGKWFDISGEWNCNVPVKVYADTHYDDVPESISIENLPAKREYLINGDFDAAGLSVKARYADGREETVTQGFEILHFTAAVPGSTKVTVLYKGKTADFTVFIMKSEPVGVSLICTPYRTEYETGEELDLTGTVLCAEYADGSFTFFDSDAFTVSGFDSSETGEKDVTVHFAGFTDTFGVKISHCRGFTTDLKISGGLVSGFDVNEDPGKAAGHFSAPFAESIYVLSGDRTLSTGDRVVIRYQNGFSEEFTVVIYGDVNGDGYYDAKDAAAAGSLTDAAAREAADCNHDGVVDGADADIMVRAGVLSEQFDRSAGREEQLENSAFIKYLSFVDQRPSEEEKPREKTFREKLAEFFMKIFGFLVFWK